jgi:hypothetical protein
LKTLVIFRAEKSGLFKGDVTAVFPYEPQGDTGRLMSCYAHIGQHSGASMFWYRGTRPATPAEYADLKRELESYGPPEAHYDLDVRKRIPGDAYAKRRAALA